MDIELGDSDANLWAAAVRGDAAAFGGVFDRHYRPVLAHCRRIAADRASAEDVASMVFLQAWRLRRKVVIDPDTSIRQSCHQPAPTNQPKQP
jgi:DNA-directed RNA polymerase specialized sigma24 family protein